MVSIEANCVLGKGAYLKDCLVMPGTVVEENGRFNNCILTGDSEIPINSGKRLYNTLSNNHNINRMLQSVFGPTCLDPETTLIGRRRLRPSVLPPVPGWALHGVDGLRQRGSGF